MDTTATGRTTAARNATPLRSLQWGPETAAGAIAVGALLFLVVIARKFPVVSAS